MIPLGAEEGTELAEAAEEQEGDPGLGLCPARGGVGAGERRCGTRQEGSRSGRGAAGSRFVMGVLEWRDGILRVEARGCSGDPTALSSPCCLRLEGPGREHSLLLLSFHFTNRAQPQVAGVFGGETEQQGTFTAITQVTCGRQ